jgi:16S rRNA (cytosine1402-N4)-methyltransferase
MPEEVLNYLDPKPGGIIVDCTLGEGGHTEMIADRIGVDGRLICFDLDSELIEITKERLLNIKPRIDFLNANFKEIGDKLDALGVPKVDGILADLGVASYHFDVAERGFSFREEAALDMRLDRQSGYTAADLVNNEPVEKLERIFREYGEEKNARAIARKIGGERKHGKIETTLRLAGIVESVARRKYHEIHPATRIFQALRIAVNRELEGLSEFVHDAVERLTLGGKLVVISFHSLEDRIIKNSLNYLALECICPPEFPVCTCDKKTEVRILTRKPVIPTEKEIEGNPRSRSSKLRACEKI